MDSEQGIKNNPVLSLEGDLFYYNLRLYVPKGWRGGGRVLESEHDSQVGGHFGQDKTVEFILRNFWWPSMKKDIVDYVQSCPECQKDKTASSEIWLTLAAGVATCTLAVHLYGLHYKSAGIKWLRRTLGDYR